MAHDGIVDSVHSLINGSLNRFAQMIRNTSIIELVLVAISLYGLKVLFNNTTNSFGIFIIVIIGLLAEGLFKIFGPTITRINNWFDSGR